MKYLQLTILIGIILVLAQLRFTQIEQQESYRNLNIEIKDIKYRIKEDNTKNTTRDSLKTELIKILKDLEEV